MAKNDPQARAEECAKRIPKGGTFLEIGVWRGANASKVLKLRRDVRATLCDPWALAEGSYATSGSSDSKIDEKAWEQVYATARRNVSPWADRVSFARFTSADFASRVMSETTFDVIFIDGDHSYEGCARDIALWTPHAKCWIGGHDFAKDSFPGVKRAVEEAFGDQDFILGADSTWWHEVLQ